MKTDSCLSGQCQSFPFSYSSISLHLRYSSKFLDRFLEHYFGDLKNKTMANMLVIQVSQAGSITAKNTVLLAFLFYFFFFFCLSFLKNRPSGIAFIYAAAEQQAEAGIASMNITTVFVIHIYQ